MIASLLPCKVRVKVTVDDIRLKTNITVGNAFGTSIVFKLSLGHHAVPGGT